MLVPHCSLRSMTESSEVGRCAMHASVRRSIALRSSSGGRACLSPAGTATSFNTAFTQHDWSVRSLLVDSPVLLLAPHYPLRSMIKSTEEGRCAMHASVRPIAALLSSLVLFSRPNGVCHLQAQPLHII